MKNLQKRIAALALTLALVASLAAGQARAIEIIRVTGPTTISKDTLLPEDGTVIASDEKKAPVDEEKPPIEEEKTPAEEEKTPAEEEKAPAEEEKAPAEEEKAPAEEEKAPAEEEKTPAEEEKTPAEEKKAPAEEEKAPVEEEKAPVEEEKTPAEEEKGEENKDEPLELDGEFVVRGGVLTQYRGKGPGVVIPEGVTQLSGKVFQNNAAITAVTLPESLEELPRTVGQRKAAVTIQGQSQTNAALGGWQVGTFAGCTALTAIHAPAHLRAAADWELAHKDLLLREQGGGVYTCSGYVGKSGHVVFPEDVTAITDGKGITGNRAITAVTFEGAVGGIPAGLFRGCQGLTAVTFKEVVADIPTDLFHGCHSLTQVTAPEGCGLTLDHFVACEAITYEGLPRFVRDQPRFDIDEGVLSGYHGLEKDVTVPEGVTEIAYPFYALEGSITTLTLPSTLKTLRPGALQDFFGIKKVVFPDGFPLNDQDPDILSGLAEDVQIVWKGESKDCGSWVRELWEAQAKRQASLNKEENARRRRESAIASYQNNASYQDRVRNNQEYLESEFGGLGQIAYKYTVVTDDIQAASDEICAGLTTDREKVTALHEWVTENIYYNYPALGNHAVRHDKAQEAYETRTCVCEGYSILMQALCTAQDIPAVVALGTAGGFHAWNAIRVDGEWLWMDATWDTYNAYRGGDSWHKGSTRLDYFLCSTEFISTDHSVCSLSFSSNEDHNDILSRIGKTRLSTNKNFEEAAYYAVYYPIEYPDAQMTCLNENMANAAAARRINEIRAENGLPAAAFSEDYQTLYYDTDLFAQLARDEAERQRQIEEAQKKSEQQQKEREEQQKRQEEELERRYLEELKNGSAEDMGLSQWAKEETVTAIENDLIPQDMRNGYTANATRLDFCRLIVRMAEQSGKVDIPRNGKAPFTDVTDPDVTAAYALGIVKGTSATTFSPWGQITRQEAAVMLARAADVLGCAAGRSEPFADEDTFADWGRAGIARVAGLVDPTTGNKVMQGTGGGSFSPLGTYTKEQAVVTVGRLFNICKA